MQGKVRIAGALALWALLCAVQACSSGPEAEGPPAAPAQGEGATSRPSEEGPTSQPTATSGSAEGSAPGAAAFLVVHRVFLHPRCMNCHPAGDAPLQGDESRVHGQSVVRGPEGRGRFALKCANCHGPTAVPGPHMPPGHPDWRLPPPETPMVFQGKSPAELARQLKDPAQTGGKDLAQLLHHLEHDSLVAVCWDEAGGRQPPPVAQAELVASFRAWMEAGAPVPE